MVATDPSSNRISPCAGRLTRVALRITPLGMQATAGADDSPATVNSKAAGHDAVVIIRTGPACRNDVSCVQNNGIYTAV
jgi:hypothetical protein